MIVLHFNSRLIIGVVFAIYPSCDNINCKVSCNHADLDYSSYILGEKLIIAEIWKEILQKNQKSDQI